MGVPEAGPHVASGAAAHVPHVFSVLLYMGDVVLEFLVCDIISCVSARACVRPDGGRKDGHFSWDFWL